MLYRSYDHSDFRPAAGSPLVDAGAMSTMAGHASEVDPGALAPVLGAPETVGDAPDIGAYEAGSHVYWLPGRQFAQPSFPIPPDGAVAVLPSQDLMFLQGEGAEGKCLCACRTPSGVSGRVGEWERGRKGCGNDHQGRSGDLAHPCRPPVSFAR